MLYIVHDAHIFKHKPKLKIEDTQLFNILSVEFKTEKVLEKFKREEVTDIVFDSGTGIYKVSHTLPNEIIEKIDSEDTMKPDGKYVVLYKKGDTGWELIDYVFDSFTNLNRIKDNKELLLYRLTDIRLIGGVLEETIEELHTKIEETDKKLDKLRKKLYGY